MSTMYVSEEELKPINMVFGFSSPLLVGDQTLALEVFNAANVDDEKTRIGAARKLQFALSNVIPEGFVGPPYSIFPEQGVMIRLVVLPGTDIGHRVYLFLYQMGKPLELRQLWYSYARCFSPVDYKELLSLKIPLNDLDRWREEILKVMEERNAPRSEFFFPESAV